MLIFSVIDSFFLMRRDSSMAIDIHLIFFFKFNHFLQIQDFEFIRIQLHESKGPKHVWKHYGILLLFTHTIGLAHVLTAQTCHKTRFLGYSGFTIESEPYQKKIKINHRIREYPPAVLGPKRWASVIMCARSAHRGKKKKEGFCKTQGRAHQ